VAATPPWRLPHPPRQQKLKRKLSWLAQQVGRPWCPHPRTCTPQYPHPDPNLTFEGAVAAAGVPLAVNAAGFTAQGIAAGSTAASMMSSAAVSNGGAVAAGSSVATLQSIGVTGLGGPAVAAIVVGGALLGGAVMAARSYAQQPTEAEATSSSEAAPAPDEAPPVYRATRFISLECHAGAVCPFLSHFSEEELAALREQGTELLQEELEPGDEGDPPRIIVYVKEYSGAEMAANLGSGHAGPDFHPGFDLVTFFQAFPELVPLVRWDSVEAVLPFLTPEEVAAAGGARSSC
jgi:hypothetical protein